MHQKLENLVQIGRVEGFQKNAEPRCFDSLSEMLKKLDKISVWMKLILKNKSLRCFGVQMHFEEIDLRKKDLRVA